MKNENKVYALASLTEGLHEDYIKIGCPRDADSPIYDTVDELIEGWTANLPSEEDKYCISFGHDYLEENSFIVSFNCDELPKGHVDNIELDKDTLTTKDFSVNRFGGPNNGYPHFQATKVGNFKNFLHPVSITGEDNVLGRPQSNALLLKYGKEGSCSTSEGMLKMTVEREIYQSQEFEDTHAGFNTISATDRESLTKAIEKSCEIATERADDIEYKPSDEISFAQA